jgi:hypothetical protein
VIPLGLSGGAKHQLTKQEDYDTNVYFGNRAIPSLSLSQKQNQVQRCAQHFRFVRVRSSEALGELSQNENAPETGALAFVSFVIPLGFEPRTLTLKV